MMAPMFSYGSVKMERLKRSLYPFLLDGLRLIFGVSFSPYL